MVVVVVGEKLTKMGIHAGQIAKSIGSYMDGGGGGKPHMATAGGRNTDSISNAMNQSELLIRNMLKKSNYTIQTSRISNIYFEEKHSKNS